jgi:hypothetical protein
MLRPNRTRQWIVLATAAVLSCAPIYSASAAITPPPKLGSCKPAPDEPPADGKEKATNPGSGGKGVVQPGAGGKPGKSEKTT